ncbi:putative tail fiber protein [Aeromonas phage Ahp1]|uniref:Putative tail fiber protein n=1 Tax=Aeromonas phage Ahp1 TaxID=1747286 RepID=A0A1S5Q8K1_9CAUD|nr:tail fiber protein [Aeromonas phage Ahp1]ALP47759.1 putative tail fiber protein [Aeromonas phage Ahp1]
MNLYSEWFSVLRVGGDYKTMHLYSGTGGDTFDINFAGGYIDRAHVKALVSTGDVVSLQFSSASRVRTSRPILVGETVLIYRDTPKVVPLAQFSDGALLTGDNLDRNAKQAVFVAAEMLDRFDTFGSSLETSVEQVSEALQVAAAALAKAEVADEKASSVLGVAEAAKVESSSAITKSMQAYNSAMGEKGYRLSWNGFSLVGTFEYGCVVRTPTDAVVDLSTGKPYKYTGNIPADGYVVAEGDKPNSMWSDLNVYSTARELREGYTKSQYARVGSFAVGGVRVVAGVSAVVHSDGLYYSPISGSRDILPNSAPDSGMVCVGLLNGSDVDSLANWVVGQNTLINEALRSKSIRGGGVVTVPAGDFYSAETIQLLDFVQIRGVSRRRSRISNAPGFTGPVLVNATKGTLGSSNVPEYLSYSGISQCTVFATDTVRVGVYARHATNESDFSRLTVQGFSEVNLYVLGCFYCDFSGGVSRDALKYGMVFGRKLYSEGGLNEVNACALNNIRSNYSGMDNTYDPAVDSLNGAGITIWSANSCAFDYVGAENSYGAGLVIRKGVNSTLQTVYIEANGRSAKAVDKIGLVVVNADFPQLIISNLNLTRNQRVYLDSGSIVDIGNLYSESFDSGLFKGTGKVSLGSGLYVNRLIAADVALVVNKTLVMHGTATGVSMSSYSSLDNSWMVAGGVVSNVRIVMIPSVTLTTTDPILIGIQGGSQEVSFGTSFTAGVPIERVINQPTPAGMYRLRHRSNSLPAASSGLTAAFAVGVYCINGAPIYNSAIGG